MKVYFDKINRKRGDSNNGFTLVELIITIVLLGIVSLLGIGLISTIFIGYSDTVTKEYLYNEAKFIIERIDRELRNSIPNTVRVHNSNTAIQFALFSDASYYERLSDRKKIKLTESGILDEGDNLSIYNTNPNQFYNLIRVYSVVDNSTDNVTLNKNISRYSPYNRFFIIETPVTIYKSGNYLKRCFNYEIDNNETGIDAGVCNILGSFIDNITLTYTPGNRWRNGLVNIDLTLKKNDVTINQTHQVNIRNVP